MNKKLQSRRDLLKWATAATALASASSLEPLAQWPMTDSEAPLRIAVSDLLPPDLVEDLKNYYIQNVAWGQGRSFRLERVSTASMLDGELRHRYDGFLTSPGLHSWLYDEKHFFGSLPYGMDRGQKMAWLTSEKSVQLQKAYFSELFLLPQVVALGSEVMGGFTKLSIQSLDDLRHKHIAATGPQADWFQKRQIQTSNLHPNEQARELLAGRLDMSDLYPADVSLRIAKDLDSSHKYLLFPRMKTAPSIFMLWKASVFRRLAEKDPQIYHYAPRSLVRVSDRWQRRQDRVLSQLCSRFEVLEMPSSVVEDFRPDALAYHAHLAGRSEIAAHLAAAHAENLIVPLRLG